MADSPEIPPVYGIGVCGGALGLELGLEAAIPGYRSVCVVERETAVAGRMAQRIEEGSLAELAWWDDVTTFDGRSWRGIVSVLSAGFPCQPFSVAGKRKGKDDERWIWPDIARIIEEIEPEIVFLENVPGLLLSTDSDFDRWDLETSATDAIGGFGTVLSDLARLGFDVEWMCLRASDVGAAHGRKRVFILAYRNGARLGRYAWQHNGGSPLQTSRSGECGGPVADTGCAGIGRATQSAELHRCGTPDDDWGTDGALADTQHAGPSCAGSATRYPKSPDDSGRPNQTMEHAEPLGHERDARSGWQAVTGPQHFSGALGNAHEPGYPVGGDDSGLRECAAVERTGSAMGNAESDEQRREWERADGRESADRRSSGDVEHAARAEGARLEQLRDILSGPADLFAPGPADSGWETLLVRFPWLRPSYSQAEAESDLRDVADGMAALVAHERTGALRALGNGVVPAQASVAFTVLLRRILKECQGDI